VLLRDVPLKAPADPRAPDQTEILSHAAHFVRASQRVNTVVMMTKVEMTFPVDQTIVALLTEDILDDARGAILVLRN
jgi:hypothetical protein